MSMIFLFSNIIWFFFQLSKLDWGGGSEKKREKAVEIEKEWELEGGTRANHKNSKNIVRTFV